MNPLLVLGACIFCFGVILLLTGQSSVTAGKVWRRYLDLGVVLVGATVQIAGAMMSQA